MVSIEERVVIPVPLAPAFAYYAEYAHIAEWDPGVERSRKRTSGPLKAGDRYDVVSLFLGQKLPMTYEVINLDAPRQIVLRGVSATGVAVDDIRFRAIDATTTEITWGLTLTLSGLGRFGEPFMKPLLTRLGRATMRGLQASAAQGLPLRVA